MATDFTMDRIKKILERLQEHLCKARLPLPDWRYCACGYKSDNTIPDKNGPDFRDFGEDERWGKEADSHAWFCRHINVPAEWKGGDVRFSLRTGYEGQWDACNPQFIAYIDGVLTQGMDVNHTELCLLDGQEEFDLDLYAYAGMNGTSSAFMAELQLINNDCEKAYYDLRVPMEILEFSDPISKTYADVLRMLNNAVNLLDMRVLGSDDFSASCRAVSAYLKENLYDKYCKDQPESVICIGHTHIDVAWQWTLEQTREKVQRSFSTVLQLMKKYPEYKFMSSQAQLYAYLKEESPETYEEVKKMIAAGRWEVEGAMWVEADCNLSSGESLVRQVMFGKRFFQKEFGVDNKVLWLPDVFGYSAALPQILKKCGVDRFVTSKISWNETNQMPYDTFNWQGLDGTRIFSYFLTAQNKVRDQKPVIYTTYVSSNSPAKIAGTWDRFQQKEFSDQVINTFGFGDGGGGPTAEMLELRRRMENGFGECPNARIGFAGDFLDHVAAMAENDPKLPVWNGELYLELHRGTYTSIAKNKRNNRKSEFAYQNAELFSSLGNELLNINYPQDMLNKGWERILLYQFHDIIPGSSIKAVYDDCDRVYPVILKAANDASLNVMESVAANVKTDGGVVVFNPNSFPASGVVKVDGESRFVENIPAKGYAVVAPKAVENSVVLGERTMENKFLKVTFDEHFNIVSMYDKEADREVIDASKGTGNRLEAFQDFPREWDAWEISNYYTETRYAMDDVTAVEPVKDGARAGFKVTRKFMDSTVDQYIWMYEDIKKVDFETTIDWKQEHMLVKVAFPVAINSNKATYEVQFGNLERPTHTNTSWDSAKFEVCAHKYCDYAEYGYGVAMMNDCKYGHTIRDGVMSLTLLKSATFPNPEADRCQHVFTYSIAPHEGDFREAGVVQMAYDLNNPMSAISVPAQDGKLPASYSLVSVDAPNVIMEVVKKAEDSDATVIRMYDAYNKKANATVTLGYAPKRVTLVDMMENEIEEIAVNGNSFTVPVKPFEIATYKIEK